MELKKQREIQTMAEMIRESLDGDKLFQSGDLSNGLHIEENWQRVK